MEKVLKTTSIFQGKHLAINEVDIDFGNWKQARFEMASFADSDIGGVMIAAYDEKTQEIVMIEQFQVWYGKKTLLLPRWGKKEDCSFLVSAQEELLEETWYESDDRREMTQIYSSPGFFSQCTKVFFAFNPKISEKSSEGDEIEETIPTKITLTDALQKIMNGEIIDARTICGIFMLHYYIMNTSR